jgi:TPR repeat protein
MAMGVVVYRLLMDTAHGVEMKLPLRVVIACLLLSALAARAGDLEDGLAACVEQKHSLAVQKFRSAAAQGSPNAPFCLGVMYGLGQGVAVDPVVALRWYRLAAQQGPVPAQVNLRLSYFEGRGVAKDSVWASMGLQLAAANGDKDAALDAEMVARQMTSPQLEEAQRLSRDWQARNAGAAR